MKWILFSVMIGILFLFIVGGIWSQLSSKAKWFCKILGWHQSPREQGFDGCSMTGTCPRCGKNILQDSQGNWF